MFKALFNRNGALRGFFFQTPAWKDVERFAFVASFRRGRARRFKRDRIAIGGPREYANEMPAFIKLNLV
jgi:hypothetical protein